MREVIDFKQNSAFCAANVVELKKKLNFQSKNKIIILTDFLNLKKLIDTKPIMLISLQEVFLPNL